MAKPKAKSSGVDPDIAPLLAPCLLVLEKVESVDLAPVAQAVATRLAIPGGEPEVLTTRSLSLLSLAKLVRPFGVGRWGITSAGRVLIEASGTGLEQRAVAACEAALRATAREHTRYQWRELRLDYYAGGRVLWIVGSHSAALALLAYAIEYHLKAALAEQAAGACQECSKLVIKHRLAQLLEHCRSKHNLFKDVDVHRSFLSYVEDHFSRRYPMGERTLLEERGYWSTGGFLLHTFDDCIIQLDHSLSRACGDPSSSMGVAALTESATASLSRAFFHDNVFAVAATPEYLAAIEGLGRRPKFQEDELQPDALLRCWSDKLRMGLVSRPWDGPRGLRALLGQRLAGLFIYPAKGEPDPDPARRALRGHSIVRRPEDWAVAVAASRLGGENVEAVFGRTQPPTLRVFDRTAKTWYRSLELVSDGRPGFPESTENKETLERWLSESEQVFRTKRKGFEGPIPAVPPAAEAWRPGKPQSGNAQ